MKPVRIPAGRTIVTIDRPATFAIIEAGTCAVLGEKGQVHSFTTDPNSYTLAFPEEGAFLFCSCSPWAHAKKGGVVKQAVCAEQEIAKLGPTMYMGEAALQGMEPSLTSIEAITAVDLLVLQRSDVVRILGPSFGQTGRSTLPAAKQVREDATKVTRLSSR